METKSEIEERARPGRWAAVLSLLAVAAVAISACGDDAGAGGSSATSVVPATSAELPQGGEQVDLDPADFTTEITNPYWPLSVGSRWVYRETDTTGKVERVVVKVTGKTKTIANGIEALVVRDTTSKDGVPKEVTDDWVAQDSAGNIWNLGEDTTKYFHGKPGTRAGSFEAGVDGAEAGIALPGTPEPGQSYRQEYHKGKAEDYGAVVSVGEELVGVPAGSYKASEILMTRDLSSIEPTIQEMKFYARGVGPVLSVHLDGDGGRAELVNYHAG